MSVKVGEKAPEFSAEAVTGSDFKKISLKDFKGKYVVLFFYPLDFTFVCPTEIIAFHEKLNEFEKRNVQVLGASVDSKFSHLAWKNTPRAEGGLGQIGFPLISDIQKTISSDYEVLMESGVAARGLFLIDREGIVKHITVNHPDIGRNIDEVLRTVDALRFSEEHGDVCPANWHQGADTIKPDPEKSKEYFSKHA